MRMFSMLNEVSLLASSSSRSLSLGVRERRGYLCEYFTLYARFFVVFSLFAVENLFGGVDFLAQKKKMHRARMMIE